MPRLVLGVCLLLFVVGPARADQAAWVTRGQADAALEVIRGQKEIREYCEPCGDTAFTAKAVKDFTLSKEDDPYWSVSVNDEGLDLAYVYVNVKGAWVNLAKLVGAEVRDVSTLLPAEPLPRLSEDLHADFLRSSSDYRAADERLNKAWKGVLAAVPAKDKSSLTSDQKSWAEHDRDMGVWRMQTGHKYHLPVPAEVLTDGRVDAVKAYAFLARSRATRLEDYTKSLKGGAVSLSGVLTEEESGMENPYLLLDDGWTWVHLCSRADEEEALTGVPIGARIRVTAKLDYIQKYRCDKNMRVETLGPPVKPAGKAGEDKAERVTVVGTLGSARVPGEVLSTVDVGPAEYYTFSGESGSAADCRDKAKIDDLIAVTGILRTPEQGLPYFDPKEPVTCERLRP